jgi:hypothetical protein
MIMIHTRLAKGRMVRRGWCRVHVLYPRLISHCAWPEITRRKKLRGGSVSRVSSDERSAVSFPVAVLSLSLSLTLSRVVGFVDVQSDVCCSDRSGCLLVIAIATTSSSRIVPSFVFTYKPLKIPRCIMRCR